MAPTTTSKAGRLKASTIQVLTQSQTQTTTEVTVSQHATVETSLQLVQTLMQACVSSLAKLRHMFDDNNYEPRRINISETVSSDDAQSSSHKPPALLQFSSLKRGVTSRADRLLDWVEKGAGDAIERGCLKAMRFALYENETCPDDRLEEWVLSFTYHTDEVTGNRTVSRMTLVEEVQGKSITIGQARRALGRFIADLAHVCTECLPDLPATVRLLVELDMNEHRPLDYCPAGFGSYVAQSPRFADTDEWQCQSRSVTRMDAGHHEVKLSVNYLAPKHDAVSNAVPPGLPCTKQISRSGDACVNSKSSLRSLPRSDAHIIQDSAHKIPRAVSANKAISESSVETTFANRVVPDPTSTRAQKTRSNKSSSNGHTISAFTRHSSDDQRVRDQIGRMLPPALQNTALPETQNKDVVEPCAKPADHGRLVLSQAKLKELLMKHFPKAPPTKEAKVVNAQQIAGESITVNCECGYQYVEGSMICCEFCDKLQHLHCLGYDAKDDERVPWTHVCYRCLLSDEAPSHLNTVRETSLCRRTIHLLRAKTYESMRELAKDLALKEAVCSKIVKRLKRDRVLTTSARSRYSIVLDTSLDGTAATKAYFDPTEGILHHLESTQTEFKGALSQQIPNANRKRTHKDAAHIAGPPAKVNTGSFRPSEGILTGDFSTPKTVKKH